MDRGGGKAFGQNSQIFYSDKQRVMKKRLHFEYVSNESSTKILKPLHCFLSISFAINVHKN